MVPIIHGDFPMTGSTLIYTCMGPEWPKAESIWYNSGTASGWDPVMHAYSIHNGTWSTIGLPQGSLLDRHDNMMASAPSEYGLERSNQIYAVLDTDDVVGHHWKLNLVTNPAQWWKYTDYPFPVGQKWNCRLVYDAELDSLYATAGYNTNLFFARCPGTGSGSGAQAGVNGPQLPGLSASARGGVVSVRYSLSVSERTRLDIYDPVGRKVLSRDMGMQSVGEHCEQVSLSELGTQRRAAHAGILLLRLTHGPTTERAKIVLF